MRVARPERQTREGLGRWRWQHMHSPEPIVPSDPRSSLEAIAATAASCPENGPHGALPVSTPVPPLPNCSANPATRTGRTLPNQFAVNFGYRLQDSSALSKAFQVYVSLQNSPFSSPGLMHCPCSKARRAPQRDSKQNTLQQARPPNPFK